jgi:putative DNA methylase
VFALADGYLDQCSSGPLLLREPAIAQIVENTIVSAANLHFALWAWCIMANHVHVLLTPLIEPARITQVLKGGTSFQINRMQQQEGRTIWQDESYDHWARDEEEMIRIIHYIENNPVKAGLCTTPADWRWSSARLRDRWPLGTPYVGQACLTRPLT